MKKLICLILLLSATRAWAQCPGGVCNTAPDYASVNNAVNTIARDGDTVNILPGTAHWAQALTITKGITLRGQTTVTGSAMDANGFSTDDQTIIIDDVTTDQVISVNLLPSQHFEITGLTFRSGTGHGNNYNMLIQLKTNPLTDVNNNVRIHHNHFDSVARRLVVINGSNYGVIDHNQIAMVPGDQVAYWPFGSGGTGGHGQWADYAWFGTDKFLFIEDNYIKGGSGASARGVTDCEGALRYVLRHNHVIDGSAGDHGTEGGTTRGERASEMYDNVLEYTTGTTANMGTRGGNKLAHDNQITKSTITSLGAINYYRGFGGGQGGPWGNADGTSPWDKCVTDVDPGGEFPRLDQSKQHWIDGHLPAYLFYSGTASADDPATNRGIGTLIVSGSPWTVGQWVGYSVTNLDYPRNFTDGVSTMDSVTFTSNTAQFASTDVGLKITGTNIPAGTTIAVRNSATSINLSQAATASGSGLSFSVKGRKTRGGYITANTDHTITFALYSSTDRGRRNRFLTGDRYQIHRVIKALDVAGSGKGDLVAIEGNVALNQAYTPHQAIWPRQIQEPTITWNNKNTVTNAYLGFNSATPFVHVGDNSSRAGLDLYNLGGPFPADSTPQKVIDVLPASINGAQYNGTFCYPHPLVTGVPCGAPTPTPTPTGTPTP